MDEVGRTEDTGKSRAIPGRVIAVVVAVLVAGLVGIWTESAGVGPYGLRVALYGEGDLYVLNLSDEEREISVDGRDREPLAAQGARLFRLVGGTSEVALFVEGQDQPEQIIEIEASRSHVMLNLSDETCLVVAAVEGVNGDGPPEVEVLATLDPEVEVFELGSRNVVWPRGYPGVLAEGQDPARAVEVIDCSLVEDKEFLAEYLAGQLYRRSR